MTQDRSCDALNDLHTKNQENAISRETKVRISDIRSDAQVSMCPI